MLSLGTKANISLFFFSEGTDDDIWASPESVKAGENPPGPPPVPGPEERYIVKDNIQMMAGRRPRQPGPKTTGPLDTTMPKKTPPGEEETRIGSRLTGEKGQDLSHLYGRSQKGESSLGGNKKELLISVPYAASMYTRKGGAIQMRATGDPEQLGVRSAATSSTIDHASSTLATNPVTSRKTLPPLRATRAPSVESHGSSEDSMRKGTPIQGHPRATGSRSSMSTASGSTTGSRRFSIGSTTGSRPGSSGSAGSRRMSADAVGGANILPPISSQPPKEFICPLTNQVMKHPVIFEDGYIYERRAIVSWCEGNGVSPVTNEPIAEGRMQPNLELRERIKEWRRQRNQAALQGAHSQESTPEGAPEAELV